MARFPLTVLLSAFLLFQSQPMLGKRILPWFGGSAGVWAACLLFFQFVLLLGYAYAHWLSARLSRRIQAALHLALLAASLLFLPVTPHARAGKALAGDDPAVQILVMLAASIGLPGLLLSSTAPLVQRWYHQASGGLSPYRLYALSNAGSLAALLSYPILVEPWLPLGWQMKAWSWAYGGLAVLSGWCAIAGGQAGVAAQAEADPDTRPGGVAVLRWFLLAACGSVLLLATTNQMCREVASTPLLWVLPLAVYLLTYMIVFHSERWYDRRWVALAVGAAAPAALGLMVAGLSVKVWIHISIYTVALFVSCLACHGELARRKPVPRYLTAYYLAIAAGGVLGGAFVALAAPALFTGYSEFPLGLAACSLLILDGWRSDRVWDQYRGRPLWVAGPTAGLMVALLAAIIVWFGGERRNALVTVRNFYGILRVGEESDQNGPKRSLTHGRTLHGFQYTFGEKRSWPTAYYSPASAIGLVLEHHPRRQGLRVGMVGLGVGTVAAYGRAGDHFRFYEIDPDVARIAGQYFTYLKDSAARIEVILGDARVQMEQEAASGHLQGFDVLAVDAFSSDAIPTHLLTAECVELYRRHLKPGGVLLFHISNKSVDLGPVARGLAERLGWQALCIESPADERRGANKATWVILTSDEALFEIPPIRSAARAWPDASRPALAWTDDFASIWRVLRL